MVTSTETPPHHVVAFTDPRTGVQGWLVIDRLVSGLAFGGFRFQPSVTRERVVELARCMTWKLAAHGSPVGGAKAGLAVSPSHPEIVPIVARFAHAVGDVLQESVILGKDMGATDAIIDGLYEALGQPQLQVIQARRSDVTLPTRIRDMNGYCRHMTGRGVAIAAQAAQGGSLKGCRVAIQGFGLVGAGAAFRLQALGAHVVALSDSFGMVRGETLPIDALIESALHTRAIDRRQGEAEGELGEKEALWSEDVDLLVLAAGSHSVTAREAQQIRASTVVEGSNFGLTPTARVTLQEAGVLVIPDIIASSASAALVAHHMKNAHRWDAQKIWHEIEAAIAQATEQGITAAAQRGTDVRKAHLAPTP